MNLTTGPFTDRSTGYHIEQTGGTTNSVFGAEMPAWRQEAKKVAGTRTAKRLGVVTSAPTPDPKAPTI
jgi:hypothetical protein